MIILLIEIIICLWDNVIHCDSRSGLPKRRDKSTKHFFTTFGPWVFFN